MTKSKNIFLVVDDGGFPFAQGDHGKSISLDSYMNILELAYLSSTVIPIGITAGYLDVDRISNPKIVNKDAEKIVKLLQENAETMPVWNHGLTHTYNNRPIEFFFYDSQAKIPAGIQQEHLVLSQKIFAYLDLVSPKVLIPPGHAWEAGVTDKIAKHLGFEAIAVRQFEKTPIKHWKLTPKKAYKQTWQVSKYIDTYWRLGLGIPSKKMNINQYDVWKSFAYIDPPNSFIN